LEHHEKYERTFGLKNYSNIFSLPYPSLLARNMKLDSNAAMKKLDRENLLLNDKIMHPVIATHISNQKQQYMPLKSLEQILDTEKKPET
jgi:hypothetical protein